MIIDCPKCKNPIFYCKEFFGNSFWFVHCKSPSDWQFCWITEAHPEYLKKARETVALYTKAKARPPKPDLVADAKARWKPRALEEAKVMERMLASAVPKTEVEHASEPPATSPEPPVVQSRKTVVSKDAGVYICSACKEKGHNRRTCPQLKKIKSRIAP